MGARYLTDLADVLAGAGLEVTTQDGWQTRARSSGGFDGDRPWCVMWHHAASAPNASTESVANYASYGSDVAPVCNIVLGRAGDVIVCAAGATNTNGTGGPVAMSRGMVPVDQMNTHAISVEAVNTGVGEPWPAAQIDAYFAINNALAGAYGLEATDCCTHAEWTPGRKIDPATASAVQGTWRPASVNSSGTWSVFDVRAEASRRSSVPPPIGDDDDMQVRLLILTDSDAQFLAETDAQGQALFITWAGPGSPSVDAAVAAHRAEASRKGRPFEQPSTLAGIYNCAAFGPVPFGDSRHVWTGAECWRWIE